MLGKLGNLSELQKDSGSNTGLVRRRASGCHLQVQRMSFGNEAHVQTTFGGVATYSLYSQVCSTSTIPLTCQAVRPLSQFSRTRKGWRPVRSSELSLTLQTINDSPPQGGRGSGLSV